MPTIFDYDLVAAFHRRGCPMCRVLAKDEVTWMDTFWREGKSDARSRRAFLEAGGFCGRHAWLLHRRVSRAGSGAAIADVYGSLARRDLGWLESLIPDLTGARRRRGRRLRRGRCSACLASEADLERKSGFLVRALADEPEVRRQYTASDGLCFTHFAGALEAAADAPETARFLAEDWRNRLAEVGDRLSDYDRKRDYRYAAERTADDQRSWTDIVRLYAGEPRESAGPSPK
ncbi:MAG TPA: DUF6062 family protein [Gaiellaceae bacterium]|nr:DUF6062 family protein [Gaiellaceae bacterium]